MTRYRVQNPATGEILDEFAAMTDADLESAIAGSEAAYREWRGRSIQERASIVRRVAELFGERKDELARLIALEMGKPLQEGLEEVEFAASIIDYYGVYGPTLATEFEIPSTVPGKAVIQRLPVGPLLGVMPWNFPYYQVARFAAPNLVLGNTILLKHAEICPSSALAIQDIMREAGVPEGVYTALFASHAQIAATVADPRMRGVSLTGSERAGAIIGELAGRHLKKAVLELGGNDAMIVLDAEDLDAVADAAWNFRVYNGGQVCNANKRFIVHADVYDEFVAAIVARAEGLVPGDPLDMPERGYGPLSSRAAAEQVNEQVKRAVADGATLHVGGELRDDTSAYFSPAVLTGVARDSATFREEIFGPVAVIYKVSSDEEAIELANDSDFGLGGSVFAIDEARAARLASRLEVGMAHVNTIAAESAELPFGGVRNSGFGREMGPLGMDEFVNKRLYFIAE